MIRVGRDLGTLPSATQFSKPALLVAGSAVVPISEDVDATLLAAMDEARAAVRGYSAAHVVVVRVAVRALLDGACQEPASRADVRLGRVEHVKVVLISSCVGCREGGLRMGDDE